ncbi:hypothetical protein EST38_g12120 [Candolleomyces aberdarensis]|uniref:Uncharacterized protein n=1 Tax=Candolleomyces aberdarensis TaxID=2316362 RepID=A0A4Q2D6D8_9AGAR|nr:hypothetical protein EST38_g12120 [Candolleomyces aberdarensis]
MGLKFTGYPDWRQVLNDEGFSDGWIDDVVRSPIGQFIPQYPRVGCILDVLEEHDEQPTKSWFIEYSIPIWWRWGPAEIKYCEYYNVKRWTPKPISPMTEDDPSGCSDFEQSNMDGDSTSVKEPEWVEFFRKREARYPDIMATETPVDRHRREQRTKNPPVRKAPVFEWLEDYNEPNTWKRFPVTMKCKQDAFDMYRRYQMRYDPFFNEWDLCEYFMFGEHNDEYDGDSDWELDERRSESDPVIVAGVGDRQECYPDVDPPPDLYRPGSPSIESWDCGPEGTLSTSFNAVQQEVEEVFGRLVPAASGPLTR